LAILHRDLDAFFGRLDAKSVDIEVAGQMLRVRGERSREKDVEPYVSEIPYAVFPPHLFGPRQCGPPFVYSCG
jgi:hypothetical protein